MCDALTSYSLLYAEDQMSPNHEKARAWWDAHLSGDLPVCLCWTVLGSFIRIGTNPRVFEHPLSLDQALARVQSWLDQPCTRLVNPTEHHWTVFQESDYPQRFEKRVYDRS